MKKNIILCFSFLLCIYTTNSFAQNSPKSAEVMHLSSIPFPLVWDQQPESFELSSTGIIIDSGKKTDLYTSPDGAKSTNNIPKLLFKPDSNFIFTTKVKPSFQKAYDGGAIMVYNDAENWAKLLFEQNVDGSLGIWTTVSTFKTGDDNFNGFIQGKEVYLKIAKSDKNFCFYYSLDGEKWVVLRAFPIRKSEDISIGFAAQSPLGTNCRVEFSDITYRAKKFSDFYSGE